MGVCVRAGAPADGQVHCGYTTHSKPGTCRHGDSLGRKGPWLSFVATVHMMKACPH